MQDAIAEAKAYLQGAIERASDLDIGAGAGPLPHFYRQTPRAPYESGYFVIATVSAARPEAIQRQELGRVAGRLDRHGAKAPRKKEFSAKPKRRWTFQSG